MDALHGPIVGIDEAGRGPWAGPVVVAAVILNPDRIPEGLNDSKVLTAEAREDRYAEIMATACVSIVIGQVRRIDRDNILQATLWGMRAAYRGLQTPAATALIDGNIVPKRFPVQGPRARRRRRPLALHRRGLHRRQGHARPADGEARAPLPALWLGIEQGLRHARARPSHQEARRVHASSPLLQPDRARASASHSAFGDQRAEPVASGAKPSACMRSSMRVSAPGSCAGASLFASAVASPLSGGALSA